MAASMSKSTIGMKALLSCALRQRLLQQVSPALFVAPPVTALQVRFRNQGRPRVREARADTDKQKTFMAKQKGKKKTVKVSEEVTQKVLAQHPVDNVWIRKYYPPPQFSIEETIERHKELAQPAMMNNMKGLIYLDMQLDFTTKKKTKLMNDFSFTVRLPHEFPYGTPPNILVFAKTEENLNLASSLGAKQAGTPEEIIKMIDTMVINAKDFDHVLCTADCAKDIMPARSYFRDKFPHKAKGNVGTDLKAMWDLHYYGYTFHTKKLSNTVGHLQVPFGQLEQPVPDLVENFNMYVDKICSHRSVALGPFITSMKVVAPPSPEVFLVKVEDYVPGYKTVEVDSDDEDEAEAAS